MKLFHVFWLLDLLKSSRCSRYLTRIFTWDHCVELEQEFTEKFAKLADR